MTTDGNLFHCLLIPLPGAMVQQNKLEELGIEVPITWEELEDAAQKAKDAGECPFVIWLAVMVCN